MEWKLDHIYWEDEPDTCLCGHYPINELCIAYAVWRLLQRGTGWARTVGSNEGERIASGRGIADLEAQVYGGYARKGRVYAV